MHEGLSAARRRWPEATVHELLPQQWKKRAGLAGNATKDHVLVFACGYMQDAALKQDAADALCIALAAQRLSAETWDRAVERGAA